VGSDLPRFIWKILVKLKCSRWYFKTSYKVCLQTVICLFEQYLKNGLQSRDCASTIHCIRQLSIIVSNGLIVSSRSTYWLVDTFSILDKKYFAILFLGCIAWLEMIHFFSLHKHRKQLNKSMVHMLVMLCL